METLKTEKEIAAKLSVITDLGNDPVLGIVKIFAALKNADTEAVIDFYRQIREGKIKVAQVKTALPLSSPEQEKIKKYLLEQVKGEDVVVIFALDSRITEGMQITLGEDLVKFM